MVRPFVIIAGCALFAPALAQQSPGVAADTVHATAPARKAAGTAAVDSVRRPAGPEKEKVEPKELELEAIAIEAVIEKPNVDIIPKRSKPDFEEMRIPDRSFARELKAVSRELLLSDDELEKPEKVDGLKKIPAKKKN
ncbi:MAG: hypothetical protein ONB48_05795 [candidate division KSB1 bacterium]|nr:hypothetical protein [candidate division KSB1 bacterium]MDZ7273061.1 hypothetical protein [candidate division KSB1 bacterium]MDZ7285164.1 hypothetical protein [candidate division KSB1 bacterium]MDZ7298196.1 hypothetical protein [candidate division KSB1 bacterium]MDZ7306870.1 hypothetical protein [candidate division KSB1 bacterium]